MQIEERNNSTSYYLLSQLAAAYLDLLVDADSEGVDGTEQGGGGRAVEKQLMNAFHRVHLPVSSNQGVVAVNGTLHLILYWGCIYITA